MLKIGEFSKLVRVSPRMLRHYEKCGLLSPEGIDKFTGYRHYSAAQIPLIMKIVTLRDMGFSIEEIGDIISHFEDTAYMDPVLRAKAGDIQTTINGEQEKLKRILKMRKMLKTEPEELQYEIKLKRLSGLKVLALRDIISTHKMEKRLWKRLERYAAEKGIPCQIEEGFSIYHDEEYKEHDVDVEIAVPVQKLGACEGKFVFKELDEVPLAATLQFSAQKSGGYDAALKSLAQWMEKTGYTIAENHRGHIVISPCERKGSGDYLLEFQVPVVKRRDPQRTERGKKEGGKNAF